ncbi:MAG: sigma factor-like helix-turn-helix DNA-binding protein [Clostridiales bacterium]|nr:sigma factor-like helix-turn-helix DNA-binding protein [Clostridiales bacterium]
MEKELEISLLLDFYGQLVTKRQAEVLEFYYNNDFSLAEISQQLNISRQGVHDNLRKGRNALMMLEEKLGLAARFLKIRQMIQGLLLKLQDVDGQLEEMSHHAPCTDMKLQKEVRDIQEDLVKLIDSL